MQYFNGCDGDPAVSNSFYQYETSTRRAPTSESGPSPRAIQTSVLEFTVVLFVGDGQSSCPGLLRRVSKRLERVQKLLGIV